MIRRGYGSPHGWRRREGTDGSGLERRRRDRRNIRTWDNVAVKNIETDPYVLLSYAPGLENNRMVMSQLVGNRGQLEKDIENHFFIVRKTLCTICTSNRG